MEDTWNDLSASGLRRLLIEEIQKFISFLDEGSTEELVKRKARLKKIFELLGEKEKWEAARIPWGKHSSKPEFELNPYLLQLQSIGVLSKPDEPVGDGLGEGIPQS
jgi:hypothetical protein